MFHRIIRLNTTTDAKRVVEFFLSDCSFDDRRHTPGELEHYKLHPFLSLTDPRSYYDFIEDSYKQIIGVICYSENEQRTGGYTLDYLVVHRNYRNNGIASHLIDHMMKDIRSKMGRYLHTYTCDLAPYQTIIRLFQNKGFQQVDYCPDYYFEGEGRYVYYMKL